MIRWVTLFWMSILSWATTVYQTFGCEMLRNIENNAEVWMCDASKTIPDGCDVFWTNNFLSFCVLNIDTQAINDTNFNTVLQNANHTIFGTLNGTNVTAGVLWGNNSHSAQEATHITDNTYNSTSVFTGNITTNYTISNHSMYNSIYNNTKNYTTNISFLPYVNHTPQNMTLSNVTTTLASNMTNTTTLLAYKQPPPGKHTTIPNDSLGLILLIILSVFILIGICYVCYKKRAVGKQVVVERDVENPPHRHKKMRRASTFSLAKNNRVIFPIVPDVMPKKEIQTPEKERNQRRITSLSVFNTSKHAFTGRKSVAKKYKNNSAKPQLETSVETSVTHVDSVQKSEDMLRECEELIANVKKDNIIEDNKNDNKIDNDDIKDKTNKSEKAPAIPPRIKHALLRGPPSFPPPPVDRTLTNSLPPPVDRTLTNSLPPPVDRTLKKNCLNILETTSIPGSNQVPKQVPTYHVNLIPPEKSHVIVQDFGAPPENESTPVGKDRLQNGKMIFDGYEMES